MRFIILRVLATASLTACASATPPSISAADITSAEAEDGTPTQLLGGELAISGTTSTTTFTATASGELDAVGEDLPFRGSADVALSLGGDVRADTTATGTTTALIGTWSGGTTSGDFEVQGSGEFFATSD